MSAYRIFDENVEEYEKWYDEHTEVYQSEILAIREHLEKLPENIRGIEVGLGTGRFSQPLGIKEGVEPSEAMASLAAKRGIETMPAVAERLPYADLQFDFVLFVTICFLDNIKASLSEANRVLKRGGAIIIGFLDKERPIAKTYKERGSRSNFFANARFYRPDYVNKLLEQAGFRNITFNQTLFGQLEEIRQLQIPISGHGKGSFVVAMAIKK